jgi:hypothetical protein
MSPISEPISQLPSLRSASLVILDHTSSTILDTIYFQFNPEKLTRTLRIQASGQEGGDRTEALRLRGAPVETIQLDAEFDVACRLSPTEQEASREVGIYPQLSALETLLYPTSQHIKETINQADQGVLEIVPPQAPVTLLVWGPQRVLPVRMESFSITEEAYDVTLNPIRAKVSMTLRVLNYDDLAPKSREANIFFAHHEEKERLSQRRGAGYSADRTGVETRQFFR